MPNKALKRDLARVVFSVCVGFALGLVVKVLCGHFCIVCPRPLTRRYKTKEVSWKSS